MNKFLFTLFLSIIFLSSYGQRSSGIVISQGVTNVTPNPPNMIWVDTVGIANYSWKLARKDSLKWFPWNVQWIRDTIISIGNGLYAQLSVPYSNPSFVNTLSAGKVFGLANVATTGSYSDLSGLPNLSQFYLASNPAGYITGVTSGDIFTALGYVPYDGTTNPNGYLTSFTEVDPTVPSYSKSLTAFSVIKSSTDPLYRPITYVPAFSDITSKPTTLFGYGITDAVNSTRTLTINGNTQDLSVNRTWSVGDVLTTGSYSNPSWITSLAWSKITGTPTTLAGYGITDGVTTSTLSNYATISSVTSGLATKVDNTRTLTINGATFDLSANRTWNVGTLVASDTISLSSRINAKQDQLNGTGFVKVSGTTVLYDNSTYLTSYTETDPLFDTKFAGKTTTNLTEGTNLYWTATRSNNALTSTAINTAIGGTALKSSDTTGKWLSASTIIPAQYNPSAGTGISISGTYPNQTITNTSPDQTVTLNSGTGISVTGTYPTFTITNTSASPTFNNTVSRTLNSNYTISSTKNTRCYYTITLSVSTPLLAGTATAQAFLEYSTNGGSTWITVGDVTNTQTVGLSVSVAITTPSNFVLCGEIPANALVRIRTNTSGTGTATYVRGQEILY